MATMPWAGLARPQSTITSATWAATENLLYPLLLLAATPVLAAGLGTAGFGVWSFYLALVALGGAASAGTATATTTVIARCVGQGRLI